MSVEVAAELPVLEAAAALLSLEELAAARVSAAEALLAGADEALAVAAPDEADSEFCLGTVLVDSSTKNGV